MREKIHICEVGPRDGLQMATAIMPTDVKLDWIGQMLAAGVAEVEAGSFVPPKLVPQMADTQQIISSLTQCQFSGISALAPNLKGAQLAFAAGAHAVIVPVSVSERHSQANTRKSTFEQIAEVAKIAKWIREQDRPMRLDAGCATAFGCSIEGDIPEQRVVQVCVALAEAGADVIVLSDTVGYGHPSQVRKLIRSVRHEVGDKLQKLHLHDTMGLGLANALAGLDEGIRSFDASLAGLGGCPFAPGASGNIVTEDLVFMLESMGFDTGIDLERLLSARQILMQTLPDEPLHGSVFAAGLPKSYKTYSKATESKPKLLL
jgi:hydroxymethylglutaryl-CoA lyase